MKQLLFVFLLILLGQFSSMAQVITFDDQGHADYAFLGNPYSIVNGGETFVFTVSNGGAAIATDHRYRTSDIEGCGNTGLSYMRSGNNAASTWTVETQSGNEVNLGTIRFHNMWGCPTYSNYTINITVEGFADGSSTGTQTLAVTGGNIIFNSNSNFNQVDKIVITAASVTGLGIDDINWVSAAPSGFTWDGSTSTDWNVGSNWSTNAVPTSSDNVVIPSAPSNQPHVTLAPGTPAVCADLTVDAGATLTIDAGKALTISGTLANAGTVDVKASATGIGSLITNGAISGAGNFKAEQYLTGSGGGTAPNGLFYYVSSPIPNATADNYGIPANNKLWIDQEPTQDYAELNFGSIPLDVGQGYAARMGSNTTVAFDGSSYNTGNITEGGLTRTGSTELNRGYNLVGNPYPSTVSWDDASRTNLETTMYYRAHSGSTMLFDTYNASDMMGTSNNGSVVTGNIAPGQGFWVRVPADGLTGSVTFENADRSHGPLSGLLKLAAEEGTLRLKLSDGTISDEQIISFNPSALATYEDYDSQKYWTEDVPQLYSSIGTDTLTINGLNNPTSTPTVALGMKVPAQGAYTLNAMSITFTETPVYLEDTELNIFQNMAITTVYPFNSDAGNIGDRFVLHFSEITGIDEVENSIQVYTINNQVHVNLNQLSTGNVKVMDMSGRMVHEQNINSDKNIVELKTSTGIYLVKVETADNTITRKVSIR